MKSLEENDPIFYPYWNRLRLKDQSFRYDTKCINKSAAVQGRRSSSVPKERKAQKNRDYWVKISLSFNIKNVKKKKKTTEWIRQYQAVRYF